MNISIFDIIGPIMIGPSSSHTAGAAKLARIAVAIINKPFDRVEFGLHGSFYKTGLGHGTDKALLAGAMGFYEYDERIRDVYKIAADNNIVYSFYEIDLGDVHENSCKMSFYHSDNRVSEVIGSSIGGGRIVINYLDSIKLDVSAEQPTLFIRHYDKKGVISSISQLLWKENINIGVMRMSRDEKGGLATTIIETDDSLSSSLCDNLKQINHIIDVRIIKG